MFKFSLLNIFIGVCNYVPAIFFKGYSNIGPRIGLEVA